MCTWEQAGDLCGCHCARSPLTLLWYSPKQTEKLQLEPSLNIISGYRNTQLCSKGESLRHLHLTGNALFPFHTRLFSSWRRLRPASPEKSWLCSPVHITLPWKMDLALSDLISKGMFLQNWNKTCPTAFIPWLTFNP